MTKTLVRAATFSVAALVLGASTVLAQTGPTESTDATEPQAATVVMNRVLMYTRIVYGMGSTIAAGFEPMHDLVTFKCASPTGCSIEAQQNAQVMGSAANNRWAMCTMVDGAYLTGPACPYLGLVPTSNYAAGSFVQVGTGLKLGTHTFQTFIYTDGGGSLANFNIVYRVYKPK